MPVHHSPFPPIPPIPDALNVFHAYWNRPDQKDWKDHTLYIDGYTGARRSFREHAERIRDAATALGAPVANGGLGLAYDHEHREGRKEIVGIISENSLDYPVLVHALLAISTPSALISSYSTPFELGHALKLSQCTCLFVSAPLLETVLPVAKTVGLSSKRVYVLGGGGVPGRLSLKDLIERVKKKGTKREEIRLAKKDWMAYLVFSSGTSGLPKGVMVSHGNLFASTTQVVVVGTCIANVYTPPPPKTPEGFNVILSFLPMHHAYGLHAYILRSTLVQNTYVIMRRWDASQALKLIPKYRVTTIPWVPSIIHTIVHHPLVKSNSVDFSSVTVMNSGAAHLPNHLRNQIKKVVGSSVLWFSEGYGLSEVTIQASGRAFPGCLPRDPNTGEVPRPPEDAQVLVPGMSCKIMSEPTGEGLEGVVEVPDGEPGELWLKGPNVVLGYFNNPKATNESFLVDEAGERWFRTGDRFTITREGWMYFADRTKDTLKVSGSQVSPSEIEETLMTQPDKLITDVCVSGVSGGRTSDEKIPRAWIVLSSAGRKLGKKQTIEILDQWHKESLSKYKWLRGGFEVVPEIPKNPTGKVLRRVLVDRYEAKQEKLREKNVGKKVHAKL